MTSPEKIAANRRNAQKSTGPRSAAGRARACRNAFIHGLTIAPEYDCAIASQIDPLTTEFAAQNPARRDIARMLAEAHLEVLRVRQTKVEVIQRAIQHLSRVHPELAMSEEDLTCVAFADSTKILAACERYERRALARRRLALSALLSAGIATKNEDAD